MHHRKIPLHYHFDSPLQQDCQISSMAVIQQLLPPFGCLHRLCPLRSRPRSRQVLPVNWQFLQGNSLKSLHAGYSTLNTELRDDLWTSEDYKIRAICQCLHDDRCHELWRTISAAVKTFQSCSGHSLPDVASVRLNMQELSEVGLLNSTTPAKPPASVP